jgi:hypothetical protein
VVSWPPARGRSRSLIKSRPTGMRVSLANVRVLYERTVQCAFVPLVGRAARTTLVEMSSFVV